MFGLEISAGKEKTEETSTTSIPGRGRLESGLLNLLSQIAHRGAGQLGDLSGIASGEALAPSQQDVNLIAQSIGRAQKLAESKLGTVGARLAAQGREDLTKRGMSGSSAEVLGALMNKLGTQRAISQSILGAQEQGGKALRTLPFQRAGLQLSANQALFDQISGAATPAMQSLLQERMAQPTTESESTTTKMGVKGGMGG